VRRPPYVVVSGPPASGKTTLARELAGRLRLPLVAKDTIKDALMSQLGAPDIETSRRLGRAAVAVMLAVARESPVGAVVESNFYRSVAGDELAKLPGHGCRGVLPMRSQPGDCSIRGSRRHPTRRPLRRRPYG
jgi:hypothetical protein